MAEKVMLDDKQTLRITTKTAGLVSGSTGNSQKQLDDGEFENPDRQIAVTQISDFAQMPEFSQISEFAQISDLTQISYYTQISEFAQISDFTQISDSTQMSEVTRMSEFAQI